LTAAFGNLSALSEFVVLEAAHDFAGRYPREPVATSSPFAMTDAVRSGVTSTQRHRASLLLGTAD
jgi:hypothetical protein